MCYKGKNQMRLTITTTITPENHQFCKSSHLKISELLNEVIGWKREDLTGSYKKKLENFQAITEKLEIYSEQLTKKFDKTQEDFKKFLEGKMLIEDFQKFSGRKL
jgi:hypothetical protein